MNMAKYAEVSDASLSIQEQDNQLVVRISDQGQGFSPEGERSGVGLFNMEERARGIGGALLVTSVPGEGTTILLTVPLRPSGS
jgi:two-component system sensor histidine kinase NreB